VNVDLPDNWAKSKPEVIADISKPLPFDDESADEIHAYHVLEHFYRYQVEAIIDDWVRVLKPNGLMVLEMPCLDSVLQIFSHYIKEKQPINERYTMWALYGDPGYKVEAMVHKWCYSMAELEHLMQSAGLKVEFLQPQTHVAVRDMRAEGIKCTA
jgi:predicted SAM-dependent methyltransferase